MENQKETIVLQPNKHAGSIQDDIQTVNKLIHNMNFNLLRAQKSLLINMQQKKSTTQAEWNVIEGIVGLIDSIQDIACDKYNYDPNDVYNFTNEVDETVKLSLAECRKIVNKE